VTNSQRKDTKTVKTKTWLALPAALALIALAAIAVGCGDDDSSGGRGNDTDAAFVNDMVPHHEAAVEMAMLANTRAEHPELRRLADDIIAAHNREIDTMSSVKADLAGEHGDHMAGDAHMSGDEHSRGMGMDPQELRDAKPFDREFIDMMIPHHRGAITMAKEELEKGENATLRGLAEDIVSAQEREIAQMREWRMAWYGSSAGSEDSMHGSDDSMHGE
jgi:uncharacterized protein (DUF305 family)